MAEEIEDQVLIARITGKNVQPPAQGYTEPTTWIRVAGGALSLRVSGDVLSQLPVDGEMVAFHLRAGRKMNSPQVISWGWIEEVSNLYNGSPVLNIQWVGTFGRGGVSAGGGIQPPRAKAK